ncbi:MAG: hypothetical protein RDU89_11790 [bacterium]|nr:hypothetical protein [bacterium]
MKLAVGVAGTAKNTGKTTVLRVLLAEAAAAGIPVGLTSIGYDGEDLDHVTGLPKPRIAVPRGTWVATAQTALRPELEVAESTAVETAVGRVALARAVRPGRAVLAGPATAGGLTEVIARLHRRGARLVLVDGAFGRLAPMTAADGLIIATGAARHREPKLLAREAGAIATLFRLPRWPGDGHPRLRVSGPGGERVLPYPALLDPAWADELAAEAAAVGAREIHLPGSVSREALGRLGSQLDGPLKLVFSHPLHLLAPGEPLAVAEALAALAGRGFELGVERGLSLLAFTINPRYPVRAGGAYQWRAGDGGRLLAAVRQAAGVPVSDVVAEGPAVVWAEVQRLLGRQ